MKRGGSQRTVDPAFHVAFRHPRGRVAECGSGEDAGSEKLGVREVGLEDDRISQ